MSEESLKDKTVKGTVWSAIESSAQYAVSFVVDIVLARLLTPDVVKKRVLGSLV